VAPDRLTLNAGDWSTVSATVDLSYLNSAPKPISPQPAIQYLSSDPRVSVSPAGEVCAGQWDSRYLTCTLPAGTDLPAGYVTITAYNPSHNVSGTMLVSVHQRAASIVLSAPDWGSRSCISQTIPTLPPGTTSAPPNTLNQVKYIATAFNAAGQPIPSCSASQTSGCVFDNDYTWVVGDGNVAAASTYGYVVARNPGVTNVYARLNGTVSQPLVFATCPPAAIVLASSGFTNGTPTAPYTTSDLNLNKGDQKYLTATAVDANGNPFPLVDLNGNPLNTLPLGFVTSDTLSGSFTPLLPLTAKLTANTSGVFSVMAACEPSTCNTSVPDFVAPSGTLVSAKAAGFGYPIYSNAIGVTVQGTSGSTVLVTGQFFADGTTPAHRLLAYDSESLAVTHTVALANTPNSMVIAPNGLKAYLGSSDGLVVVDLTSFQSSILNYPVAGGSTNPPELVTGTVLGVSSDSRYVVISDTSDPNPANNLLFLIDTTGTKVAARYTNLGRITAVTFAADSSNFWVAGDSGVFTFSADTFVPISSFNPADAGLSTHVKALAWMPDGQSYFASGDQLINYSTCDDQNPQSPSPNLPASVTGGLSTYTLAGVPHLVGLSGTNWFNYSVTTTAQVGNATAEGNVCLSKVTINPPATATSSLKCTANQVSFSPIDSPTPNSLGSPNLSLLREFVTGVDPTCATPESVIHSYDVTSGTEINIATANPVIPLSGGLLNDGRKLYFGTYDQPSQTALLHRINFDPTAGSVGEDIAPATVDIIPSFVAVVPK
jgi:YD repeat-containing protein